MPHEWPTVGSTSEPWHGVEHPVLGSTSGLPRWPTPEASDDAPPPVVDDSARCERCGRLLDGLPVLCERCGDHWSEYPDAVLTWLAEHETVATARFFANTTFSAITNNNQETDK